MLSEEKTTITHIDDGFDFLGWTFRGFKGKHLGKPSEDSIKVLIKKCSTIILKEGKASTQSDLIRGLNQVIRGWTNYHKHVVASQVFSYVNNTLDKEYFIERRMKLRALVAARKGEEMLEPYELETLTYGP